MKRFYRIPVDARFFALGIVLFILFIEGLRFSGWAPNSLVSNLFYPVGVLIMMGLALFRVQRPDRQRPHEKREKMMVVLSVMLLWGIIYFLSGLMTTYMQNSLVSGFGVFVQNIWVYLIPAIAIEVTRFNFVKMIGRRNIGISPLIVALFFFLYFAGLSNPDFSSWAMFGKYFMSSLLPLLVANIVLTYLAWSTSLGAMLIYRVGDLLLMVFLPILPRYDWYASSMTSILVAVVVIYAINSSTQNKKPQTGVHRPKNRTVHQAQVGAPFILMTALVLFSSGLLSYRPVAILSNSMVPTFNRGDMIVAERFSPTMDIHIGDIVEYSIGSNRYTHRVVSINKDYLGGEVRYITQGDANSSPDLRPVTATQVKSFVRARIPLVGYPTVWLNETILKPRGNN